MTRYHTSPSPFHPDSTLHRGHEIPSVAGVQSPSAEHRAIRHSHRFLSGSEAVWMHQFTLWSRRLFQFEQSRVNWVTASELDSDTFETQRGADGILLESPHR